MSVDPPVASIAPSVPFDQQIIDLLKDWAADTFAHGGYPQLEMRALADAGLLTCTLPGEPLAMGAGHTRQTLKLLRRVGKGNLSVGRIFEGHLNALLLIDLFADATQRERWYKDARNGHLFGVWNTQAADGMHIHPEDRNTYRLAGSKTFCSGSVQVTRPLITGTLVGDGGWQMAVVPLDRHQPDVDTSFWSTLGMRNSVSHKIDFTGIHLTADDLLGQPGDYNQEPHLSGGAVRFAAVQLGGAEAILHATRSYLRTLNRTDDPHQKRRVGQMVIAVESGKLWLRRAGKVLDATSDPDHIIYTANQVRTAIADVCRQCLTLSDLCVGARGMMPPQDLARLHADLSVYLRQPAPDAALDNVGQHFLGATA